MTVFQSLCYRQSHINKNCLYYLLAAHRAVAFQMNEGKSKHSSQSKKKEQLGYSNLIC